MKGVSPLIAEIILIAVVFSIATAVIVVLGGVSFSVRTLDAKLGVDGFEWRSQRLVIHHLGGDIIRDAFLVRNGTFSWGELVVKKSGREVEPLYPRLNGKRVEYLVYEDMGSPPSGVLKRSALYLPENQWVRLTLSARENGQLEYVLPSPPSSFVVEFQFWAGGGPGRGSTWFYAYCSATPENENWPLAGGYVFAYNENSDSLEVWYGGSRLARVARYSINDNRWHDARIVFDGMVIEMYMDNRLDSRIRYIDYQAANRKGKTLFGWGARAGGATNEHRIRNLRMWILGEMRIDFSPGDVLEFEMKDPLVIGDAMTITYLPQNKLLYMNDIS